MDINEVNFDTLDVSALQNIATDLQNKAEAIDQQIGALRTKHRELLAESEKAKCIIHERSLQVNRWCHVDTYDARSIFEKKLKQRFYPSEAWAYLVEKQSGDFCKIILVCESSIYYRDSSVPVDVEQLDTRQASKLLWKGEKGYSTYRELYYATPAVVKASLLTNASLEIVVTQPYLLDLVQRNIPDFKSGLAAYIYQDNKWFRLRTRYYGGSGIPVFVRTRG